MQPHLANTMGGDPVAPLVIAGMRFERLEDEGDECAWVSADDRIVLFLLMMTHTVRYPWRVEVDGIERVTKFSTPYVAVIRTLEGMKA